MIPKPMMPSGADATALLATLGDPLVHLEPLGEEHREGLRAACAADREIWEIYPVCMIGEHFGPAFDAILANPARLAFASFAGGVLIGTTAFLQPDAPNRIVEIGGTYLAPDARGTAINRRIKTLMIDHAIAYGFDRIEFRVDTRNARSMRAVEKLGAKLEGVMRRQRITWTGYRRDTALYSLLANEWPPP
jgi:RimJ/RimL family protein N-acetyltransferase